MKHIWPKTRAKGLGDSSHEGLVKAGFQQSQVNPYLYYRHNLIFLIYIDDCLLLSPSDAVIDTPIQDLQAAKKCFNMEGQGMVNEFLGIKEPHQDDGTINLTQPQLIELTLQDLHLSQPNITPRKTPALTSILLHKDSKGKPMCPDFHYCSVIGKLNFLEESTHPDIAYVVHQCTHSSEHPKQLHASVVKRIG